MLRLAQHAAGVSYLQPLLLLCLHAFHSRSAASWPRYAGPGQLSWRPLLRMIDLRRGTSRSAALESPIGWRRVPCLASCLPCVRRISCASCTARQRDTSAALQCGWWVARVWRASQHSPASHGWSCWTLAVMQTAHSSSRAHP